MDQAELDSDVSERKQSTQNSKKRKVIEKTVVRVRVGKNAGKLKNEGPPSDFWSWRKYGQKPIKGSPFPRGYYRCSTLKGCSAKKMVERCRTDSSMLIITYTSTHNHPGPDIPNSTNLNPQEEEEEPKPQPNNQDQPDQDQEVENQNQNQNQTTLITSDEDARETHNFHYIQSPVRGSEDIIISQEDPFSESQDQTELDSMSVLLDEEPISCQRLMKLSTPKCEENDFFDELEELPTYSAFRSLMHSSFFDERIPVVPS